MTGQLAGVCEAVSSMRTAVCHHHPRQLWLAALQQLSQWPAIAVISVSWWLQGICYHPTCGWQNDIWHHIWQAAQGWLGWKHHAASAAPAQTDSRCSIALLAMPVRGQFVDL
jgi:hypothetical protein